MKIVETGQPTRTITERVSLIVVESIVYFFAIVGLIWLTFSFISMSLHPFSALWTEDLWLFNFNQLAMVLFGALLLAGGILIGRRISRA